MSMSFAQSYILASKVRAKLTKDASNPKASLRNLVVQANMLDNLMDHISNESSRRLEKLNQKSNSVKFELPNKQRMHLQTESQAPSVVEYEVESDESEEEDYESESDSDYYYSSEDEDEEAEEAQFEHHGQHFEIKAHKAPIMGLSTIQEEVDNDMPELTKSISLTDSEDEEEEHLQTNYYLSATKSSSLDDVPRIMKAQEDHESLFTHHHQRKNAIYTVQEMF